MNQWTLEKNSFSALLLAGAVIGSGGCLASMDETEDTRADEELASASPDEDLEPKGLPRNNGLDKLVFWEVPEAGGVDYDPKDLLRTGPNYTALASYWVAPLKYIGKCALPAGKKIQVKVNGANAFEMVGDLGYAGGVDYGNPFNPVNYNDPAYTQKLSACVSALGNGDANTLLVTLAAATVFGSFTSTAPFNEAGFFGDFFNFGEHNAFVCTADGVSPTSIRACNTSDGATSADCPWIYAGKCSDVCEVAGGRLPRSPVRGNSRWCEYRDASGTYRFNNPVFVRR